MLSLRTLLLAGATCLAPMSAAWAQAGDADVEEVLVTALRRETLLQDTPIAVSAFSN